MLNLFFVLVVLLVLTVIVLLWLVKRLNDKYNYLEFEFNHALYRPMHGLSNQVTGCNLTLYTHTFALDDLKDRLIFIEDKLNIKKEIVIKF